MALRGQLIEPTNIQAGGSESYTGIDDALFLGGTIFGRKRKKQADGQICPLCQLLNTEEAESCSRCYYEFTVAAHRQMVSEITEEESGDLFDALLQEEEEDVNDTPLVDWTAHSFSMDDMTVEVSPYDDDGLVEIDQSVSMEHQFDAPQQVARVKGQEPEEEEEEYVLTAADAPKNVTKFDTGDGPDLAFEEEEYSAPVVKLIEMTESADIEPVQSASAIPDEMENGAIANPSSPISPAVESVPPTQTELAPVTATPVIPAIPAIPEVPTIPMVPEIPVVPELPKPNNAPEPTPTGIWPWPQSDAWDDTTVRKALRDAMESAKSGDIDASKRTMVGLGPHLGERVDLVFHVGVLLKRFEQEEVMRRMIESAQRQYPDSPEVAKAAQHLLS
ncbi:MAG: hypothetical protein QF612_01960 [Candidatus Thalassarchaeaceae archaeon]|nr:hypothetical protein [Candidatus Thalassarchaeaceae archaeon]